MDYGFEHVLIGGDLLRHAIEGNGADRPCLLTSTDDKFKAGEPAFIDCAQLKMHTAGPVNDVIIRGDEGVIARSVQQSRNSAGQSDGLVAVPSCSMVDDISALIPKDVDEARQIANAQSAALQMSLPGSYHYWLMRKELCKLVEVHPALEDSVSIPFMHEQENRRWACVHAVMQGKKYMAYSTSGKPVPSHPDPCDRAISKRNWEKSMRNWRQDLGDV